MTAPNEEEEEESNLSHNQKSNKAVGLATPGRKAVMQSPTGPKAKLLPCASNLEPAYLAPPSIQRLSRRRQMSLYTGALDHELRSPRCGA